MKTMKMMKATRPLSKLALLAPLALSGIAVVSHARADSIYQTTLVAGSASTVDSITAQTGGSVTIDLQSLNWPTPLSSLSFSLTSASSMLGSWNGTGLATDVATFSVAPGTYYAHIIATANASSALDMGLYSVALTFTPAVPLPATGWMLLTGLFVLVGIARAARRPLELTGTAAA